VAFQLQDDLLNITESSVAESKGGTGDDITEGKITLMVVYTLSKASEVDRKRLRKILGMHTRNRKLISEAIAIIAKYGAEEYTKTLEGSIVKKAWVDVDKLLPDSDSKKRLKAMAEFLINRSL
jgi:geranylgeranyl pyrophosphate synthase